MYKLGMNLGTMYADAMKAMQDLQRETLKLQRENNMLTIRNIEKLFRQEIYGNWSEPFQKINEELNNLLNNKKNKVDKYLSL